MSEKFNQVAMNIYKSIRKSMPRPVKKIESKKDQFKRKDIKQGRKDYRNYNESHKD